MDKSIQSNKESEREKKFRMYLTDTSKMFFNLFFSDGTTKKVPYRHRWESHYRKSILARLYSLQLHIIRTGKKFGMLSLTTSQAGKSDYEILEDEQEAWGLLRQTISKLDLEYFMVYEPHMDEKNNGLNATGIPHIHVLIVGDITQDKIDRLQGLWHGKYEMGHPEHDFKFTGDVIDVDNIVNYLMAYLSKTVLDKVQENDALLRFHSLFWETHSRMWSTTRGFSCIMRYRKKDSDIKLMSISLEIPEYGYSHTIYQNIDKDFVDELEDVLNWCSDGCPKELCYCDRQNWEYNTKIYSEYQWVVK